MTHPIITILAALGICGLIWGIMWLLSMDLDKPTVKKEIKKE